MTDPAAALRTILLATALLEVPVGVFVAHVPAGTKRPYVVIQGLSDPGHHSLSGPEAIGNPLFQMESYGGTSTEADALARSLVLFLDGFRGRLGALAVQGIFKRDSRGPTAVIGDDGAEPSVFRVETDFQVWRGK